MKKLLGIIILKSLFIFISCASAQLPKIDYSYSQSGSSNTSSIAVKDYQTRGIIIVKSSEVIYLNGNHTGSKITYEMLMLEAQKLGADDVINIRIDINQKENYSINGERISTTYSYTATALAIKYTTAIAVDSNRGNFSQNTGNNELASNRSDNTTSVKARSYKNWISGEINMLGAGFRYERMINPSFSIGANLYYQYFGIFSFSDIGIDFTTRLYPGGKSFYIGADIGFHMNQTWNWYTNFGFAISPGIGVKLDVGKPGGFFMDIGIKAPIMYGISIVPHIGFGGVF